MVAGEVTVIIRVTRFLRWDILYLVMVIHHGITLHKTRYAFSNSPLFASPLPYNATHTLPSKTIEESE